MKKVYSLLLIWILISCQAISHSDNYKLYVTLENAPFDSLYILECTQDRYLFFSGEKTSEFTWEFTIPDSIIHNSTDMRLKLSKYDYINKQSKSIRFLHEVNGKKNVIGNIGVQGRNNYIHAIYVGESIFPNEYFFTKIGEKDTIMLGELVDEDFKLVLKEDNSDITVRSQDPFFCAFLNSRNEDISYDEYMKQYVRLSQKYPDSWYLISSLASSLYLFKTKEDVLSIYQNLSDSSKNTHWGEKIERYLYSKFSNSSLPTFDNAGYENIVQDSLKYNLLVFTASWCHACIEEIPLLKQIYKDLNSCLDITYISLDEENEGASFQQLIYKEKIPWRTLLAYKDIKNIEDKYFVVGVPHCILVYPNQTWEFIEIRDNEQLKKLYSLCSI
ncbi:TlpA family protein disulfide reductase [Bacteroides sp. AN502(2024)]|uniref:TlpA family protein disulfide reductase n=1 Tax=Bacteroides sp. AN502(2024) TaxID=3160599 RepID=UPI0035139AE8